MFIPIEQVNHDPIYNDEYFIRRDDEEYQPHPSSLKRRHEDKEARDKSYKKQKTFIPLTRENIELLTFPDGITCKEFIEKYPKAKDKNYICTYLLLAYVNKRGPLCLKPGCTHAETFEKRAEKPDLYGSKEFFDDLEALVYMVCFIPLDRIIYKPTDSFTYPLEQAILKLINKKKIKPFPRKKEFFPNFDKKLIKEILKYVEDNLDSLLNSYNNSD